MADTAIEDSYITTIEIGKAYFANNPKATAFLALQSGPMSWYFQEATRIIDSLHLKGQKYLRDGSQARQFPRVYRGGSYDMDETTKLPAVPIAVLNACCEEAFELHAIEVSPNKKMRLEYQRQGVTAYSYAGSSEQYAQNPSGAVSRVARRFSGLVSSRAYDYMAEYIARSFPIV